MRSYYNFATATYGGHLELSAFAHLTRHNVKVVQPGLVYVIEWATDGDLTPDRPPNPELPPFENDPTLDEREKRRLRRDQKRIEKERFEFVTSSQSDSSSGTVYVAYVLAFSSLSYISTLLPSYHDWEHFSSIRNLKGPHSGLPHVEEIAADSELPVSKKKPSIKIKSKSQNQYTSPKYPPISKPATDVVTTTPPSPQISRPSSPSSSHSPTPLSDPPDDLLRPPYLYTAASPPTSKGGTSSGSSLPAINIRIRRSPKRGFDESSCSSSEGIAKRTRSSRLSTSHHRRSLPSKNADADMDVDEAGQERDLDSTPGLSAPGSSAESTTSSEASSPPIATPSAPPSPPPPTPTPPIERPLTRRQRKLLGLPKPRAALLSSVARHSRATGSGKIVIPGGRFKNGMGAAHVRNGDEGGDEDEDEDDDDGDAEWKRNGTGRVDVRGFRELKI